LETFAVRNLNFTYPLQTNKALKEVSFVVPQGEFVVLCGPSGCGKSTLLRHLKTVLAPHGRRSGEIFFEGESLDDLGQRRQSTAIGFVQQSVDNQIVTDKVWHELAFGLEGLGYDTPSIRRRVAEMASFFGIQNWFYKDVTELSGGQKQLLNLAAIMTMQPSVLILDEPTSQLDPLAASDFIAVLGKINRELGTTILMTEHRLEEVFPLADRVLFMDDGQILVNGTPQEVGEKLLAEGSGMFLAMPSAMRIWAGSGGKGPCPVTVRDGREWFMRHADETLCENAEKMLKSKAFIVGENVTDDSGDGRTEDGPAEAGHIAETPDGVLSLTDVWFRYEKEQPDVVRGLQLSLREGEFLALLGGNGTGKSTTLSLMAGLRKPYRGSINVHGRVSVLPQDPRSLFVKKTVLEDLQTAAGKGAAAESRMSSVIGFCRLNNLLDRHPFDLSGGEQQRAALAKVLLTQPDILLMDEPTKGMDADFKQSFAAMIRHLQSRGVTVFMVSHDVEFCAEHADRCALFFDGNIVTEGPPRQFFAGNSFYTTSANRIARDKAPWVVTVSDAVRCCCADAAERTNGDENSSPGKNGNLPELPETREKQCSLPLPLWRKLCAILCGLAACWAFVKAIGTTDLSTIMTSSGLTALSSDYLQIYSILLVALLGLTFCVSRKQTDCYGQTQIWVPERKKLPRRTKLAAILILLLIPFTIFIGVYYLGDRKYYFISMLILLETMLPFVLVFEGRKPQPRELVTIAVLCALGVAGRAAFFMLPNFKPVLALVIIAGIAFGGETGFLVGSMTMLVSNIMFGQGPWTPWQMFAMGIVGFLAGVFYRRGLLQRRRLSMSLFGAFCALVVYGGIMNPASALIWTRKLSKEILLTYYLSGFPVDLVHGAATFLFLWFGGQPMLEKLDRIKVKYGMIE